MNKPIKILFVCLGNICRSPMAEAVMTDMVNKNNMKGQVQVDSAGTAGYHAGDPADYRTLETLSGHGIAFSGTSRKIVIADFYNFDLILAMDTDNLKDILALKPADSTALVRLFLDGVANVDTSEVPDPYYDNNFEKVYQLINTGCQKLLTEVTNRK